MVMNEKELNQILEIVDEEIERNFLDEIHCNGNGTWTLYNSDITKLKSFIRQRLRGKLPVTFYPANYFLDSQPKLHQTTLDEFRKSKKAMPLIKQLKGGKKRKYGNTKNRP